MTTAISNNPNNLRFGDLTRDYVMKHADALVDIASDVPHEYWTKAHFLTDLPLKWTLSFMVEKGRAPVAYAIISKKGPFHCHLHHFMVHRAWRGRSFGGDMIREMERRSRAAGLNRITLKIAIDNERGLRFYERYGYVAQPAEGGYLLMEKHA